MGALGQANVKMPEPMLAKQKQLVNAVKNGNLSKVTTLLKSGVSPDTKEMARKEPVPVLVIAAFKGHRDIIRALLVAGATKEPMALMEAMWKDQLDCVKELIQGGVETGKSFMLEIAKKNRVNILKVWLKLGMKKKEIELFVTICKANTELNDRSAFGKHCLRFLLEPDNLAATGMDEELLATFVTESAHCGKATF